MNVPRSVSNSRKRAPSGGMRLNKKPALIAGGVVTLFILGIIYASSKRAQPDFSATAESKEFNIEATPLQSIDFLANKPDGLVGVDRRNPNGEFDEDAEKARKSDIEDRIAQALENQRLAELNKNKSLEESIMRDRFEMAQAAYNGETGVRGFGERYSRSAQDFENRQRELNNATIVEASGRIPPGTSRVNGGAPPNLAEVQQLMAQMGGLQGSAQAQPGNPASSYGPASVDTTGINESRQYLSGPQGRDFRLNETVQPPPSEFALMTGTIIPGVMISAANSDLPGDIVAQVSRNVYDTRTGRHLLIPQGTKLFGRYDAFTALGQNRLLIVWDRLVFPDTETLAIGGMQGYDGRGMSGFKDKTNDHFFSTLFYGFLLSAVGGWAEDIGDRSNNDAEFIANIQTSFGDASQSAVDQYISRRLKIKPTLEIRAGYPFNIIVSKDMTFREPYEYGYTRLSSWR